MELFHKCLIIFDARPTGTGESKPQVKGSVSTYLFTLYDFQTALEPTAMLGGVRRDLRHPSFLCYTSVT